MSKQQATKQKDVKNLAYKMTSTVNEPEIKYVAVGKLTDLKYSYRFDIRDRKAIEQNFQKKFKTLNRVNLTDAEFACLRDESC